MAEAISQEEESFTCPLCLDLLNDPVTIPCGHNFCMRCIEGCWDQEDQKGVYSCPLCKHTFTTRPVLYKNPLIAEMVEKIRKTRIQATTHNYAGPGDVECDVCTGKKRRAVKSCLECLVSYCETHFKVHNEATPRKHSVIDATGQLQEMICTHHNKVFEIFCRTDQSCICYLCVMDEHKGHDTVTAAEEMNNKQKQLGQTQRRFQQRIQEREKELQELRKAVETLKSSAQTAVEDSERIFTEMIHSIERRRSEVTELIRAQEKAEVSRAEGLLKKLEQEIAELKRRDDELEQLSHTEDHIHFLKNMSSFQDLPHSKDLPSMTFNQTFSFEAGVALVSSLKVELEEKLGGIFKQEVAKISAAVAHIEIIKSSEYTDPEILVRSTDRKEVLPPYMSDVQAVFPEPVTREKLLQYSCHFTLDPNTAHGKLHLSEGNRRVEWIAELQSYPDHPERFDGYHQVLCREGLSGHCYWEVEWSRGVHIAVSYKSINRKGGGAECGFGCNNQSWRLKLSSSSFSFRYINKETKLPLVAGSRIGVYVDHRAGTLAFYSITDTMTLMHRVQTTFTHTLYPGFTCIDPRSSVKLL
ncbi:tripartite motif-containing protein 16-like protein [Sardina pilchardus]|uniref:tripartite motif-containing protein 16-like protein n=1 Tax=Sardina pilchardus TaxID=27697 RepID=UPI002E13C960